METPEENGKPAPEFSAYDVIVVGAGFSGTLVGVHLARNAPGLRVLLMDRIAPHGPGVAYRTRSRRLLMNVRAANLSALPDQPDHFVRWLRMRDRQLHERGVFDLGADAFVPRFVYGAYLRELLRDARARHPGLSLLATQAAKLRFDRERIAVETKIGAVFSASRVVLALGNFSPRPPAAMQASAAEAPGYLDAPWSGDVAERIPRNAEVLVLGSGLTALDALAELHDKRFEGRVHVLSRRGLLPLAHEKFQADPDRFRDAAFPCNARGMVRWVRSEARMASSEGLDWRAVVDALRPRTQEIWRSWSDEDRRRFARHARAYWEIHRHRAPPEVAAIPSLMMQDGRLVQHRGRAISIRWSDGAFQADIVERGGRQVRLRVGFIVNCTGPEADVSKVKDPFLPSILADGFARPDPLGLGLLTARDGAVINDAGRPSRHLYALGNLRRGTLLESTAIPELRVQARDLADQIIVSMRREFGSSVEGVSAAEWAIARDLPCPPGVPEHWSCPGRGLDFKG
ncbi:MAG: FAD/NAD(P)-binding protein [Verrucomicrobiae bacterium]|nr:FAD/NAD(P)-binding protein [Verrucomicrobiae bacterium]